MHQEEKEGKVELTERLSHLGSSGMCDYSLHNITSRSAKVGDKLITRDFGTGTRGFAGSEDKNVAICVRPGTELSFVREVKCQPIGILCGPDKVIKYKEVVFRQINKERVAANHECAGISRWPDRASDVSERRPSGGGSSATGGGKDGR